MIMKISDMNRSIQTPRALRRRIQAFTLVEVMVAMAIGVTMIGLAMGASVDLYKDFTAANAYRGIHENARKSLAYLSRDLRSAIGVTSVNTTNLSMTVISITGTTNTISYSLKASTYDPAIRVLNRQVTAAGVTTNIALTDHATDVTFEYWENPGNGAAVAGDVFEVRAVLFVTNTSGFRISTDRLQTRVLMRNKHY